MTNLGNAVNNGLNNVQLTIIGIFAWLVAVIFVLLSTPLYLYRFVITKLLAPCLKQDLGEAVSILGNGSAVEFWGKNKETVNLPTRCAIVVNLTLKGTVSTAELEDTIRRKWIEAVDEKGDLSYPEFQQYIDSWMGFMFWRTCKTFQLRDHVTTHILPTHSNNSDKQSQELLHHLVERLVNKPFPIWKSPWEIHLINNYRDNTICGEDENLSVLLLRIHHGMADGFSIMNVLMNLFSEKFVLNKTTTGSLKQSKTPIISNFFKLLATPVRLSMDMGYIASNFFQKETPWHVPDSKKSWYQIYEKSNKISILNVKAIKNKLGVSFTSVLFSTVAAAFAKKLSKSKKNKKLDKFTTVTFVPLFGHENKLTNHFTGAFFDLPISPDLTPLGRLKLCEKNLQNSKNSVIPFVFGKFLVPATLSHIAPVAKFLSHNRSIPSGVSSFPCSQLGEVAWNGRKVITSDFVAGTNLGVTGIGFFVISYVDHIQITAAAESSVFKQKELKEMMGWIEEEIEILLSI